MTRAQRADVHGGVVQEQGALSKFWRSKQALYYTI